MPCSDPDAAFIAIGVGRSARYATELNPTEGIWSLLKQHLVNFAAVDLPARDPCDQAGAAED